MIRINKILCPVDFSPPSTSAVNYAAGLALNYGAKLKLLHVVSPVMPVAYEFVDTNELITQARDRSKHLLGRTLGKLKNAKVNATGEVRTGEVFFAIKRAIDTYNPDLVIMGTHGRKSVERWFLGSITERLLRHSPVPLMTVSSARQIGIHDGRFRRILVTTDFSAGTADALEYAFSIGQENQARLTLLHVVHDTDIPYGGRVMRGLEKKLDELIPADSKNWCEVDTRLETGTPYQRILDIVKEERIDLIVMNIHGKGMLARALAGSNAERVVRAAACPVMLIPPMPKPAKKTRSGKRAA
jgi:nucleotide-binding universal stress UspA family protein